MEKKIKEILRTRPAWVVILTGTDELTSSGEITDSGIVRYVESGVVVNVVHLEGHGVDSMLLGLNTYTTHGFPKSVLQEARVQYYGVECSLQEFVDGCAEARTRTQKALLDGDPAQLIKLQNPQLSTSEMARKLQEREARALQVLGLIETAVQKTNSK